MVTMEVSVFRPFGGFIGGCCPDQSLLDVSVIQVSSFEAYLDLLLSWIAYSPPDAQIRVLLLVVPLASCVWLLPSLVLRTRE